MVAVFLFQAALPELFSNFYSKIFTKFVILKGYQQYIEILCLDAFSMTDIMDIRLLFILGTATLALIGTTSFLVAGGA
ncbi:hypothetical protein DD829_13740 [Chryseobacterium sp. HMWF035]|nr:hypothetical protein DBR25_18335 [Chryseobacterium sp. HMWF001]PVV55621.1 hypothetical protein DD829_13740 [Chryseobacterium sp. HMWF035]